MTNSSALFPTAAVPVSIVSVDSAFHLVSILYATRSIRNSNIDVAGYLRLEAICLPERRDIVKAKFPLLFVLVAPTSHFPAFLFAACRIPNKFDFLAGEAHLENNCAVRNVYFLNSEFVCFGGEAGARRPVNPHFVCSPHYTGQKYSVRPGATYGNTCAIRGA